ncbi:hypothetical protein [Microbacterium lacticum]|uniref:hypothetical protein n=1 Tax=Microbacterium lacticum TaxID=33885 RepID=UPI001F563C8D|nr:hypothetical protein [Microbacterium lacticum]
MSDHAEERQSIERAIADLVSRDPSRVRPTVVELCAMTGLPRWKLTHRHVDLKDDYLDRVVQKWGPRAELSPQSQEISRLRDQNAELRTEVNVAKATIRLYAEALEELRLQIVVANGHSSSTRPVVRISDARTSMSESELTPTNRST